MEDSDVPPLAVPGPISSLEPPEDIIEAAALLEEREIEMTKPEFPTVSDTPSDATMDVEELEVEQEPQVAIESSAVTQSAPPATEELPLSPAESEAQSKLTGRATRSTRQTSDNSAAKSDSAATTGAEAKSPTEWIARPVGRAPRGKAWDHINGKWVVEEGSRGHCSSSLSFRRARGKTAAPAAEAAVTVTASGTEAKAQVVEKKDKAEKPKAARAGRESGKHPRPPGRPPVGKMWDFENGVWVSDGGPGPQGRKKKVSKPGMKSRPPGRAPRGKKWDGATGTWLDMSKEEAAAQDREWKESQTETTAAPPPKVVTLAFHTHTHLHQPVLFPPVAVRHHHLFVMCAPCLRL